MKRQIKSYLKYGYECGIASKVQGLVVDVEPHPRHKGMWRFVDISGQPWVASDYAFDDDYIFDEDENNERKD